MSKYKWQSACFCKILAGKRLETFKVWSTQNTFDGTVTATSFTTTSDYRIKDNVQPLTDRYGVSNLKPVSYYNKISKKNDIGFIAHEVQELFPELVSGVKDGEIRQSLNYTGLVPILVKEVKEIKANNSSRIKTSFDCALETTTSSSYTTLNTDSVITCTTNETVQVTITASVSNTNNSPTANYMAIEVNGATIIDASDTNALIIQSVSSNLTQQFSATFILSLTPGINTFSAKYKTDLGTASFSKRRIIVQNI